MCRYALVQYLKSIICPGILQNSTTRPSRRNPRKFRKFAQGIEVICEDQKTFGVFAKGAIRSINRLVAAFMATQDAMFLHITAIPNICKLTRAPRIQLGFDGIN
jgi:hypothetical protein